MPDTPIYGIPYQGLNDAPDGAALGQGIAEAVEDQLERIDATINSWQPIDTLSTSSVNITIASYTGTGTGHSFVAPPSGAVRVDLYATLNLEASASVARSITESFQVRTGGTVGSGTIVHAVATEYGVSVGVNTSGARNLVSGSSYGIVSGLTPGNTYNIETLVTINVATGTTTAASIRRRIMTTPVPGS